MESRTVVRELNAGEQKEQDEAIAKAQGGGAKKPPAKKPQQEAGDKDPE